MVKFSIVIPLYNKEKFIEKTLDSILLQSYKHYNIIIIDDCSTDSSYNIAKEFKDRNQHIDIVLLKNPVNKGVSFSRNIGIDNVDGDYIMFLDADDELINNHLLYKVNNYITRYKMQYILLKREYYNGASKPDLKNSYKIITKIDKELFKIDDKASVAIKGKMPFGGSASAIISKDIIGTHRFDVSLKHYEDWLFFIKLYLENVVFFYNISSVLVNLDENSVSRNLDENYIYNKPKIIDQLNGNREENKMRKYIFWLWMTTILTSNNSISTVDILINNYSSDIKKNITINKHSVYSLYKIITRKMKLKK